MLKKTITYHGFDDEETEYTEDFYFHLSENELTDLNFEVEGGLANYVKRIRECKDYHKMIELFKDLIRRSYGVKSADGKRFIKDPALFEAFSQTDAYTQLYLELGSEAKAAADFVNGIIPKNLAKKIQEQTNAAEALNK